MRKTSRRKKINTEDAPAKDLIEKPAALIKKEVKPTLKTESFSISWDPLYNIRKIEDDTLRNQIIDAYFLLQKKPDDAIEVLLELKNNNQDIPILYNLLYTGYNYIDEEKKARQVMVDAKDKFPDLLFGKLAQAELLILDEKAEQIAALFNNEFDFRMVMPEKNSFHIVEALSYYYVIGRYFVAMKDFDRAKTYMEQIHEMDPKNKLHKLLDAAMNKTAKIGFFRRAWNKLKKK